MLVEHLGGSSPGVVAGRKIASATGCPGRSGEVAASSQLRGRAFFQKCGFLLSIGEMDLQTHRVLNQRHQQSPGMGKTW